MSDVTVVVRGTKEDGVLTSTPASAPRDPVPVRWSSVTFTHGLSFDTVPPLRAPLVDPSLGFGSGGRSKECPVAVLFSGLLITSEEQGDVMKPLDVVQ